MEVNDGMGHAVHATVAVTPREVETADSDEVVEIQKNCPPRKKTRPAGRCVNRGENAVLGLSILMNLFFGMYVWKRKK
ncbi:MAG: hypothetical protein R2861_10090 [Desulfobacterales bacterium]